MRDPLIAGVLSLLVPGLGQIYNGQILLGLFWLLLTGASWIGSVGFLGWVVHIIAAYFAYTYAKQHPVR
jgi:TM2 domain-containing membrane protein YozV